MYLLNLGSKLGFFDIADNIRTVVVADFVARNDTFMMDFAEI